MNSSDLELNLETIERLGAEKREENYRFRAFLKGQDSDKVDRIVHRLNREVSERIDCTTCGNCCTTLKPSVTGQDVQQLSERLGIPVQQVKEDFIEEDDEGDLFLKLLPCSFLHDKKCTVYSDRPDDCRSYPHLHKPRFISRLFGVIENYSICPIVFNVMEKLKKEFSFR